jgi:hypothetical protein
MAIPTPVPDGIKYIKISKIDQDGVDITTTLESLSTIVLPLDGLGNKEYKILNRSRNASYFLFFVDAPDTSNIPLSNRSSTVFNFETQVSDTTSGIYNQTFIEPFPLRSNIQTPTTASQAITNEGSSTLGFFPQLKTYPTKSIHVKFDFNMDVTGGPAGAALVLMKQKFGGSPGVSSALEKSALSQSIGGVITNNPATSSFIPVGSSGGGTIIANTTVEAGDFIYVGVFRNGSFGSGTDVVASGSLFISSSTQDGTPIQTVVEPYLTSPFYGGDCDVTYGDISQGIPNQFIQDIEYNSGIIPTNLPAIINNTAVRSDIPQSNYTQLSSINIKYRGCKVQSQDVNVFDPRRVTTDFGNDVNIGNYGQTPSINSFDTTIYEYEWGGGTTPEIMGGGSVKIGKVLQVNTKDSVQPISPGSGFGTVSVPVYLVGGTSKWNRNPTISQSVSDLYYVLNGNNAPGDEIQFFPYPNQQPGTQPTIPNISKIITTEYGVPTRSTFMVTSSANYNNSAFGAGLLINYSDYSEVKFYGNREIAVVKSDYSPGTTVSSTLFISGSFLGGSVFGRTFTDATSSMMPIQDQLNIGERWFFTWFTNLETEGGFDSSNLNSKVLGNTPLLSKGITEISGISQSIASNGIPSIHLILKEQISSTILPPVSAINIGNNGSSNQPPTGEPLGFLMWRARSPQRNEFIIVEDEVTGGVGPGAFTDRYTTEEIVDNFEEITRNYGNNTSG